MSKKQSSIQWLEQMVDNMIVNGGSEDLLAVIEHIQQAKAMHKTEHFNTWWHGISQNEPITFEQYYNETFKNQQ
jgi:hypothetical protein